MPKILINYGHRRPQESRFNAELLTAVRDLPGVTFNDLATRYPDFRIDGACERQGNRMNDTVVDSWNSRLRSAG